MTGALLASPWDGNPERYRAMASKETIGSQTAKAGTPPFLNWGQTDAAAALQKAFLESCDQASRTWLTRMQSEVSLWSDLANKLSGTKSMPEAFEAYSQCVSQRMQMCRRWTQVGRRMSAADTKSCQVAWQRVAECNHLTVLESRCSVSKLIENYSARTARGAAKVGFCFNKSVTSAPVGRAGGRL